jgi:hypothetical protein
VRLLTAVRLTVLAIGLLVFTVRGPRTNPSDNS